VITSGREESSHGSRPSASVTGERSSAPSTRRQPLTSEEVDWASPDPGAAAPASIHAASGSRDPIEIRTYRRQASTGPRATSCTGRNADALRVSAMRASSTSGTPSRAPATPHRP
jgi:hypothetical protein